MAVLGFMSACSSVGAVGHKDIYSEHEEAVDTVLVEKEVAVSARKGTPIRFPPFLEFGLPGEIQGLTFSPSGLVLKRDGRELIAIVYEESKDIPFHDKRYTLFELYSSLFGKTYSGLVAEYSLAPKVLNGLVELKAALELDRAVETGVIGTDGAVIYYYIHDNKGEAYVFNREFSDRLSRVAVQPVDGIAFIRMLGSIRIAE